MEDLIVDTKSPTRRKIEEDIKDKGDFKVTIFGDENIIATKSEQTNDEGEDKEEISPGISKNSCFYFEAPSGCKNGDKCRFQHYRATVDASDDADRANETYSNQSSHEVSEVKLDQKEENHKHRTSNQIGRNNHNTNRKNVEKLNTVKQVDNNQDNHVEITLKNRACNYYIKGRCKNGTNYQYLHTENDTELRNQVNMTSEGKIKESDCKESGTESKFENINSSHVESLDFSRNGSNTSSQSDKAVSSRQVCRNYTSNDGCNRKNCKFLHELPEKALLIITSTVDSHESQDVRYKKDSTTSEGQNEPPVMSDTKRTMCHYFNSKRGCKKGQRCPNIHENCDQMEGKRVMMENENNEIKADESLDLCVDEITMKKEHEVPVPSTDTKNTEVTVCRYFNSQRGCYKRHRCPNIHENRYTRQNKEKSKNEAHQTQEENSQRNSQQVCKFFISSKGCMYGSSCQNLHPSETSSSPSMSLKTTDLGELRRREMAQLEKRFAGGKCSLGAKEPNTVYYVHVSPTDPDWPFLIKDFELAIDFPEDYPKQLFTVTLQEHERFPPQFSSLMNEKLEKWCDERQAVRNEDNLDFRPFLKWFDKNLINMFRNCATMVKRQLEAQQAGITLIHHDHILPKQQNNENAGSNDNGTVDGNGEDVAVSDNNGASNASDSITVDGDNAESSVNTNNNEHGTELSGEDANELFGSDNTTNDSKNNQSGGKKVKKGTEVKFPNLHLSESVATMRVKSALLTVECNRCKSRNDYKVKQYQDTKKASTGQCKKCNVPQSVAYHSELIHPHSPIVGYLHMEGCKGFDFILNDSSIGLECFECYKENQIKSLIVGSKKQHWCQYCSLKMEIHVKTVKFNVITSAAGVGAHKNPSAHQETKKKIHKEPGIREGQPLPDNGACKHYKKSFRWLRFPCCGKAYPCDVCHDEKEGGDHETKFASKMICGFCAKEQPYFKDKPCIACKENVTKSRSTHWEGGKGCRDRSKMARNDKQKTAGAGKTISRNKANDQDKKKQ